MATSTASAVTKVETRTWVLQAETELRFDVSAEHTLTVVVSYRTLSCRWSLRRHAGSPRLVVVVVMVERRRH